MHVPEEVLSELERLDQACTPGPWQAFVEDRDFESGTSFIMTGPVATRGDDIYVYQEKELASDEYLDLIAMFRTYLPHLVSEVRESRAGRFKNDSVA